MAEVKKDAQKFEQRLVRAHLEIEKLKKKISTQALATRQNDDSIQHLTSLIRELYLNEKSKAARSLQLTQDWKGDES